MPGDISASVPLNYIHGVRGNKRITVHVEHYMFGQ